MRQGTEIGMLVENNRFNEFLTDMAALLKRAAGDEAVIIREGRAILADLVSDDSWYPDQLAQSDPQRFKQYMLHRDETGLTVLGVVWEPGQSAPPHDHTIWGLVGQLRGMEATRIYERPPGGGPLRMVEEQVLRPGQTAALSPTIGDIHDVRNLGPDVSISIHVYGGNLEALSYRRSRFDAKTGAAVPFTAEYH